MKKHVCQRTHFKNRVLERYGLSINKESYKLIVDKIQNGESTYLGKRSLRTSYHKVDFYGTNIIVVYDKTRGTLVTALSKDMHMLKRD
jgi:hypothetical protein